MNKVASSILKIFSFFIIIGTAYFLSAKIPSSSGSENGFTGTLLRFIDSHERKYEGITAAKSEIKDGIGEEPSDNAPFAYKEGDWSKYVITPKYAIYDEGGGPVYVDSSADLNLDTYGSYKFNIVYGKSRFTDDKYRRSDEDKATSGLVNDGLDLERQLQLYMVGNMGKRTSVYIDYDSEKEENTYVMKYKAQEKDEVIREINAGQIDIKLSGSKYAVYDDNSSKGMGLDITVQKGDLNVKAFGSVARGETVVENFRGNSASGNARIADYQYVKNTYYQLEPYRRYDGLTAAPVAGDDPYNTLITFTSSPSNPETYRPSNVNISSSGFAVYMDDQNPYNNSGSITLALDGGYYDKHASGTDYTVNFSTGLITFLKTISSKARIFAVYTLTDGTSSDPAARTDISQFSGQNFVFIKYGSSINEDADGDFILDPGEDTNGDGRLNTDIYEVRSVFSTGQKLLSSDNFSLKLYRENSAAAKTDNAKIGKYKIDYTNGLISFYLREPFRILYSEAGDDVNAAQVYSENQSSGISSYSKYNLRVDYYREARSFQLQHTNIISGSMRIKINSRVISSSLYTVDYTSGYLQFTDSSNPVISSETDIEVKYEYLPAGQKSSTLDAGARAEYNINKNLKIGGTVLFSRQSATEIIPDIGSEPLQTLVLETDASLRMGESSLKDLIKAVTGYNPASVPLEIRGYAEYAKSIKNVNTFGKALVDNMETNENIISISMSDKDWQLSSMPYNSTLGDISQTERGLIYYYYYRDPSSPDTLHGISFSPYSIAYPKKPGPYNIAMGHIDNSIQKQSNQKTLALNFDFSGGNYIPVVTRNLSSSGTVDLSGLEYIEVWYKSGGGTGNVELYFDIGTLNEDADGDGNLDTEDDNSNGVIDYDDSYSEDTGFTFNPSGGTSTVIGSGPGLNSYTTGDGLLNTEDLDGNGTLDTPENRIRLPGSMTTPYNDGSPLTIDMSDTAWQKARIYLDKSSADYSSNSASYEELLKAVQSVRLFLRNQTATTGIIYIDSIKLVSSIWGNIMLDDAIANSPTEFSLTLVDSINDPDYRADSFMVRQEGTYKSLYGDKSDSELESEKETAIQIDYDLSATTTGKGSVTKTFSKTMDIRAYKTMNVWLNYRAFTAGDRVSILVGSSESDYIEYQFDMDYTDTWREMKLKLKSGSSGSVGKYAVSGSPDLKRISLIRVEINGQAGRLWLDDIYLSEPLKQTDSAYWYEGGMKVTKPLFRTKSGTSVFSDLDISYIKKGHGANFSTIGQTSTDIMEDYSAMFSSVNILPNWNTKLDYIIEKTETDSLNDLVAADLRGVTEKRSLVFESNYLSNINVMPSIKLLYKQDSYDNKIEEDASSGLYASTVNDIYTPSLIIEEKMSGFLYGNLLSTIKINLYFKDEKISRNDPSYSDEYEKREKENINFSVDYRNNYFFVQPAVYAGKHEIVEYRGKTSLSDTQIQSDFSSGFHFPFAFSSDSRLVDRQKKADLKFGSNQKIFISPDIALGFYYTENNFTDYSDSEKLLSRNFLRAKDAVTTVSNGLNFPFNFSGSKNLKFIRILNFYYSRSLYLEEAEIPYEGESASAFNERYGISRTYGSMAGPAYNLFNYYPWYFFRGRGNYARGRDLCYNTMNTQLESDSGSVIRDYTNHIRLIDNSGFSSMLDFEVFNINLGSSINQVSERQALYGIPQEVISINCSSGINLDLMRIFSSGFFRPNRIGIPHHSATLNFDFTFVRNMLITSNVEDNTYSPGMGLTLKRDRTILGIKNEFNYHQRNDREYISLDEDERNGSDDIYAENMSSASHFKENDKGYKFSILYETDVLWLYGFFNRFYQLTGNPIFNIEYSLLINRYDYTDTTSPEPFDQHLLTSKLTLDLHKNVQGGLTGIMAWERYRNRYTGNTDREILSYEIALNFSLIF